MDTEISRRIASSTFARLSGRVWDNPKLTIRTKSDVYRACVCSTLQTLCTAAKRGPCKLCRRRKLMPYTSDASVVFSELGAGFADMVMF